MKTLSIKNITLLVGFPSVDTVFLDIDAPSNFPNMNYIPCAKIELQKGHGLQWVKETFGCEPDRFIDGKQG